MHALKKYMVSPLFLWRLWRAVATASRVLMTRCDNLCRSVLKREPQFHPPRHCAGARHVAYAFILLIILAAAFGPVGPWGAEKADAQVLSILGWFGEKLYNVTVGAILQIIGLTIMGAAAGILWLSGTLLDFTINQTVTGMRDFVDSIDAIKLAWATIRDVANMLFIFILLYIAIRTILQANSFNTRQLLVNLIAAALFINFSLFLTQAIIDASNVLTLAFKPEITYTDPSGGGSSSTSISKGFMQALRLTSTFDSSGNMVKMGEALISFSGPGFLLILLATTLFLITAFVFFVVSILFTIRFGVLILLMVLSPLAFAGMILPRLRQYSSQWWNALMSQAIFAPLFMLMIGVVLKIINHPKFLGIAEGETFAKMIVDFQAKSPVSSSISIFFNFVIIIVLLIASIIIAKQVSASGGGAIQNAVSKGTGMAAGFFTRNTAGRLGQGTRATGEWMQRKASTSKVAKYTGIGLLGGQIKKVGEKGEKATTLVPDIKGGRSRYDVKVTARRERAREAGEQKREKEEATAKKNQTELEDGVKTGNTTKINDTLDGMTPNQIADLAASPAGDTIFANTDVIDRLSPVDLDAIHRKGISKGLRTAIIARLPLSPHPGMAGHLVTTAGIFWR